MNLYTAIATSAGRDTQATSSDGKLNVKLAMQKELGGNGNGTNPEQLFAAGYAACFATSLRLVAQQKKVDASGAEVTSEVGLCPNGLGGYSLSVVLRVHLPDHLSAALSQELVDATHHVCPYSNATRDNIPVSIVIE